MYSIFYIKFHYILPSFADYLSNVFVILHYFRDGVPYCEQDYQSEFGVTCAGCDGYITGKVLQVST